ncbi:tetratricopeptide repeat protein [Tepidicella baoligensis]|uniref:tetratricopeptide repeat protein n=1 Tax=Tepidicella baoligensis TaxID=2707016 RepID=UPI001C5CA199|nr:tetratricopeptide repeat protein [Tepidicella baoligensis]
MLQAAAHLRSVFPHTRRRSGWLAKLACTVALSVGTAQPLLAQSGPTLHFPAAPDTLSAELFYQLLLAEFQLQNQDPGAAYSLMLDAAKRTQRPELYRRAVEIALQNRAGNAALTAARDWSAAFPDADEPYRYELQILLALNRPADVSRTLRNLIRLTPAERRSEVISAIPQTLARTSDRDAALAAARDALQPALRDPATAAAAWAAIGRMELERAAPQAALAAARSALQAQGNSAYGAALAVELFEREVPGAEPLVQAYLQRTAGTAVEHRSTIHLAYIRALIDLRRLADAQHELEQLLTLEPDQAQAWLLQGILLTQQRRATAAEAALERYLELSRELPPDEARPGQTQAFLHLAQIAEQRGDFDAANAWLDRIENADDILSAQIRRATILARQGHIEQARELIRRQPERTDADTRRKLLAEAHLLREVKAYEAAYETFTAAAQRFPDDPDLIYEQALAAERTGRFETMEALLRDLIARHPDYHHAYNALGYSLADRNERLEEAKSLIQKALAVAPNDAHILDSLGWVEFRLGNKQEALRILQDAFRRLPDAEIAAHLGEVHWALGQQDAALNVWREGLLLNPENETLLNTLQRLRVQP